MAEAEQKPVAQPRRQGRSPAYPSISLKKALEQADVLHEAQGKYAVPMPLAFSAWGYGAKSSGGRDTRAALKYFGLITIEGDGDSAKVKLTEDALRVLLDKREDQTERNEILRRLATVPPVHKALLTKFPDGVKSAANAEHFLIFEQGFNEDAAAIVVAEFVETAEFTGLYNPANKLDKQGDTAGKLAETKNPPPPASVSVGNIVQWTPGGVAQFSSPRKVEWISDDGAFARVFGSPTGMPVNELTVVKAGEEVPPVRAGSNSARDSDFTVYQTGKRLQITADVDLDGIKKLKDLLTKYEEILKLLN